MIRLQPFLCDILFLSALILIVANFAMRVKLGQVEPSNGKLFWWRQNSGKVGEVYENRFPHTSVTRVVRASWWLMTISACCILLLLLWKR